MGDRLGGIVRDESVGRTPFSTTQTSRTIPARPRTVDRKWSGLAAGWGDVAGLVVGARVVNVGVQAVGLADRVLPLRLALEELTAGPPRARPGGPGLPRGPGRPGPAAPRP